MKKEILLAAVCALFATSVVSAQNGPRKSPEERVQMIHQKLDSAFRLTPEKMSQVDEIFLNSFKEQQKKMDELRAGTSTPDREAMKAARDKAVADRDAKLKLILTEDQMKVWKEQIEPTTRPQRGNPNGGPRD